MCVAEIVFVQLLRRVWLLVTQKIAGHQASLFFIGSQSLLKLTSTDRMSVSLSICMYFIFCTSMYIYKWRDILCNVQVSSFIKYTDVYIWVIVINMCVKEWIFLRMYVCEIVYMCKDK